MSGGVLVAIPALDEARHIGAVLDGLAGFADRAAAQGRAVRIVVADGGSRDATRAIVAAHPLARRGTALLLDNPARLQSAGVNRAVAEHGAGMDWLLRVDAHARYPDDYADILLGEAAATGADAVVVPMRAVGEAPFQRVAALAQNHRVGNGGSPHRVGGAGRWVAHGHHALMRMDAFRAAGGYDPAFSHNEDAELDHRLAARGARLWLTGRTGLDYLPRRALGPLLRQYRAFGRGRARTMRKHGLRPGARQAVAIAVLPVAAAALLAPLWAGFALPLAGWLGACLAAGAAMAWRGAGLAGLGAGLVAAAMHLAWSAGFWDGWLRGPGRAPSAAAAERAGR